MENIFSYTCSVFRNMARIDDEIKTKFINDKQRFITNLVYTATWFRNQFIEFLKPTGLSPEQFNILRILRGAKDWVTMNAIKDLMIDKAPNATRLSDKLLSKGLINRKRSDNDRRVVYLEISQQGLDLLEELDKNSDARHMDVLERITTDQANEFSDILDQLRG